MPISGHWGSLDIGCSHRRSLLIHSTQSLLIYLSSKSPSLSQPCWLLPLHAGPNANKLHEQGRSVPVSDGARAQGRSSSALQPLAGSTRGTPRPSLINFFWFPTSGSGIMEPRPSFTFLFGRALPAPACRSACRALASDRTAEAPPVTPQTCSVCLQYSARSGRCPERSPRTSRGRTRRM